MSEEAKEVQKETKEEQAPAETTKKKINRLSLDDLNKKISEMEGSKMTHSKYYIHLMQRKRELEAS